MGTTTENSTATDWKIFYLFLDGIGFGLEGADNPFTKHDGEFFSVLSQKDPYPSRWAVSEGLATRKNGDFYQANGNWTVKSIDPSSDVKGLPQSGTGQTSLFTGVDAPLILNRHVPNFPSFTLKKFIKKYSLFKLLSDHGRKASLLNSYSPFYLDVILPKGKFISASTLAQTAADLPLMDFHSLVSDDSLYMDITHNFLIQGFESGDERMRQGDWTNIDQEILLTRRDPAERGKRFVEIGRNYDLVLFEYFFTDKVGHDQDHKAAATILKDLEAFISGAINNLGPKEILLISSDHGNLEDLATKSHTHNAVPLYAAGDDTHFFTDRVDKLADIPRAILERFGIEFNALDLAHTEEL